MISCDCLVKQAWLNLCDKCPAKDLDNRSGAVAGREPEPRRMFRVYQQEYVNLGKFLDDKIEKIKRRETE